MKYLKIPAILVALFTLSITACNLDEKVYSDIIATETKLTAKDLVSVTAPGYTQLRNLYWDWDGLADLYDESTDIRCVPFRIDIGWGDYYITMHQHNYAPNISYVYCAWDNSYKGITNINRALYQLESMNGVEAAVKESVNKELRALRAFYYYILFDNFRNIPVITKYDLPEGYLPTQSTPKEAFDFIVSELTETMDALPTDNNKTTYGRFTKWAAKMTLAKLYLNHEVYFGTPKWAEAQAQVQDIIDCGLFSLAGNYKDPFLFDNENSVEEIFSIPFDSKNTDGSYHPYKALHAASQQTFNLAIQPWNGGAAIPQFIDTYDADDTRLKDTWLGGPQVTSTGAPLMLDGKQFSYPNVMTDINGCYAEEGYRLAKYEIKSGEDAQNGNDIPMYRYTDALMIKAECLLRTGHADDAAVIVSDIRARAFKAHPEKATVTGAKLAGGSVYKYGEFRNGAFVNYEGGDDIQYGGFLDELGWEFVAEHHRKQDLIRFNVYETKSWFCKTKKDPNKILMPIPEYAINANQKLIQNPGY